MSMLTYFLHSVPFSANCHKPIHQQNNFIYFFVEREFGNVLKSMQFRKIRGFQYLIYCQILCWNQATSRNVSNLFFLVLCLFLAVLIIFLLGPTYRKVASSRPVYYSILELFDQCTVTVHKHQISPS